MPLADLDIIDLVKGTLYDLGRMRFQQIAQNLTDYEVFPTWFKKDKVMFDSGIGIQRTLMSRLSGQARHVGLSDTDQTNIVDLVDQLQIPWRHAVTQWGFFRQETLMNRGEALIFNVILPRRADAMISLVEELENKAWAAPPSSTDKLLPFGIPYWIVKNSTLGFNGGYPSGFTTIAGVSLTNSPNFKNYTGTYALNTGITKFDLIKKLRTAFRKCSFKSPVDIQDYRNGSGNRYRTYTNEPVVAALEDVGESQNENLGRDIASIDGVNLVIRGFPIRWARALDADTQNPFYGIDHAVWYPVCLKGDYLRETDPSIVPFNHNAFQTFVDLSYNYLCVDRRRNFVFYGA